MRTFLLLFCIFLILPAHICLGTNRQHLVISSDGYAYIRLKDNKSKSELVKYDIQKKGKQAYGVKRFNNSCTFLGENSSDLQGDKTAILYGCTSPSKKDILSYRLIVVDTKTGQEIISLNNGRTFAFSPKNNAIVYVEEIPGERGSAPPPGYNAGVWLYDFNSKAKKQISKMDAPYIDLNWSEHDGNIYFTNGRVVCKYNAQSGIMTETAYKGIYFSPDGRYYIYHPVTGEGDSEIYRTSDNKRMIEWETSIRKRGKYNVMSFQFWSKKLDAVAFFVGKDTNVLFDINQGEVIAEFSGYIVIGTNADGTLVAVRPYVEDYLSIVEIINLLDILSKPGMK